MAYLSIVTGAVGVVGGALRTALGGACAVYGVLLLAWLVAVGWALLRVARHATKATSERPAKGAAPFQGS